jgi:hypothetical protein
VNTITISTIAPCTIAPSTPGTHYLLEGMKPGQETVALWALESIVKLSRLHGHPLERAEATQWLSRSTEKNSDLEWVNWRLDSIFE